LPARAGSFDLAKNYYMRQLLYIIACTALLASCNKHNDTPPVTGPPVVKSLFSIKLNPQFLGSAKTDSAIATWKKGNVEKRIHMQVQHDSLVADIALFDEGQGELVVYLYSNIKLRNQYYTEWVFKKTLLMEKTKPVGYSGPQTFFDAAWLPRVELFDAIGHRAVLGLRPEDPYFLVKKLPHTVVKLTVAKEYWKGIQQIGGGEWNCATGCTNASGDVENSNFFSFLPGQIGAKAWNHISVGVIYAVDHNSGWVLTLEYEPE
jgi:hypothetical protein